MTSCAVIVLMLLLATSGATGPLKAPVSPINTTTSGSSWNPAVACTPTVTTIEHVLGNNVNSQGGANYVGGGFELATPPINLTNPQNWSFWKRWLPSQIQCSYAINSTSIASFVEIDNVRLRIPLVNEDCSSPGAYVNGVFCDTTINIEDPNCPTSTTDPYLCRIHVEIDQAWKNAGIAAPNYPNSTQPIDIQGYVYWDPAHESDPTANAHSFSGWELHPVTAWRFSCSAPSCPADFFEAVPPNELYRTVSIGSSNASTVNIGALNGFVGTITLNTQTSAYGSPPNPPRVSLSNSSFPFPNPSSDFGSGTPHAILTVSAPAGTSPDVYNVTVTAQGASITRSTTIVFNVGASHIDMSASSVQMTVNVGSFALSTISVTSANGFSGIVSLSAAVSPPNSLGHLLNPPSIALDQGQSKSSTLNVTASPSIAPGTYVVTVTGTSGLLSNSTKITVNVVDFSIAASPTIQTIQQGNNGVATITATGSSNGFTGIVSLSASVSPSGTFAPTTQFNPTSISLSQTSLSGSSTLTISTTTSTPLTTYTIKVTGTSGPVVRYTFLTVNVTIGQDFAISANPTSLNVIANDTSSSTLTVVSQVQFSGTVNLTVKVLPVLTNGLTASLSSASVTVSPSSNGVATVLISTTGLTVAANYTITITGNATVRGGTRSHSVSVMVEVSKFTLSSNPTSMTILASSQGTSVISVNVFGHFSGTVTLNAVVASPLSASISPGSITAPGGTSTLTVTTTSDTPSGGKTVTITGTSGKFSYVLQVQVTVAKFLISKPIPGTLLFSSASSQTSTVTLQSFGGFAGTVSLVATVAPNIASSPTIQLNPSSLNLVSNGSNSSALTVTTTSSTPYQNYTVTITATYRSLSRSTNMTVTVINFNLSGPAGPMMIPAGSSASTTITISLNGFSGTVCLSKITQSSSEIGFTTSPPYNPPTSPCVPVSDGGTGSVTLTVNASPFAAAATRTITVVGTSGTKTSGTLVITIKVGRFSVTPSSNSASVLANSTYTQTITVTSLVEFSGDVTLSWTLTPSSTTTSVSFNPQTVTLTPNGTATSILQISPAVATNDGTYTLTITGFSGSLTSTPVNIVVYVTKFNILANPTKLSFGASSSATTTLTVNSLPPNVNGFAGTVNIFVSTSSPSITASANPPAVTLTSGSSQTAVLSIGSSTPGNNYIVFVKASSGSYSNTIQVRVNVTSVADFSIAYTSVSPNPVPAGSSASSTIVITSAGGFSGSVSLTGVVQQSSVGITITFQPNPVPVPTSGSSSLMTIATTRSTLPGNYNIIVTGTNAGGTPSHTDNVPFAVSAASPNPTTTSVTCSSPVVVNQGSTCTVQVTDTAATGATTPTGTVTLSQTGLTGSFTTCTLSGTTASATCTSTFSASTAGTASVTANYLGDGAHSSSSGTTSIVVNTRPTTTTVNCSPASIVPGQSTSCTATVNDPNTNPGTQVTPTGTVTFSGTGAAGAFTGSPCNLVAGALGTASCPATFTAGATSSGTANIVGTYSGDSVHASSTSASFPVTVGVDVTTTSVSCTTPVVVNQGSTCSVQVTDTSSTGATTPTGAVSLTENGVTGTFTTCTLSGTTASVTCTSTFIASTSGIAAVAATYSGDTTHGGSQGSTSIVVNPRTTATTVSCSPSSISPGTTTICTATVTDSSSAGTVLSPTGSVTFSQNGVTGSFSGSPCSLVAGTTSGTASCQATLSASSSGTASITSTYSGDTVHSGSASNSFPVTVNSDPTTTTVDCSPSTVTVNTGTSCSATVKDMAPAPVIPTGPVSFTLDSSTTSFSSCNLNPVNASSAGCSVTFTPAPGTAGTHTITATYSGDIPHPTHSSGNTSVIVTTRPTVTNVSCSTPVTVSTQSSCTVTVSDSSTSNFVTPTGSFNLASNNTGIFSGPCTLSGSTASATCTVSYTPSVGGGHAITANYPGDNSHSGSSGSSDIATTPIPLHPTSTSVNCQSPVVVNQASTCTATVTDISTIGATTPTGTVSFVSNGFPGAFDRSSCLLTGTGSSAGCSANFTPSSGGTASVTASYSNDATHSSSTGTSNSVVVTLRTTSTTVQCATPVNVNQPSNCTATVADSSTTGSPITPAGTVTFGSTGAAGGFTGSPCTLVAGSTAGTASCGVTFTAPASGTATVTGTYSPDPADTAHSTSTSSGFGITVNQTVQPTTTGVSCPGPVVVGQASTCTATVTSTSTTGATTPTGTVAFSSNGATGAFTGSPCTLVAGSTVGTASCTASFTPSATGTASITGVYTPASTDTTHSGSTSSPTNLTINTRSTSTSVACAGPFVIGVASTCTATVTDTSPGTVSTPTGSITWTSTGSGSLSPPTCNLTAGATTGTASCSVNFTPSAPGTSTVTGAYGGDPTHSSSTSTPFTITTGKNGTSTSVTCTSPVTIGQASTCTANVSDTSTVGAITPTGTVSFSSTGTATGSFTGIPCTVVAGVTGQASCTANFTPSAAGTASITAIYNGDTSHASSTSAAFTLTVNGDFGISANPTSVSVDAGLSGSSIITITSSGFAGSVTLSITSPSNGLGEAFSVNPVSVATGGTSSSNMTITVPSRQAAGTYLITITGTSGTISHSTPVTVNVADFQIFAGPVSPSAINPGAQGTSTISVTPVSGFTDTVNLSVSASSPAGLVCTFTPTSIQGGSGTSNLSCSSSNAGDYTITVTGTVTSRGGTTAHPAPPITFHVVDFGISVTPSPVSFTGSQGSMTVTATALNSFQGTVNLAWTVSPTTGLTVSCQNNSLPLPPTPDSTPCQLTASPGSYTVNVTGTSGSLSHFKIVVVNGGDFNMSGPTTPVILTSGEQSKPVITVNSNGGFSGFVSLQASTSEPSITFSFNPTTVSVPAGGSALSTLTLSTTAQTPSGNYTVFVQGNSGSLVHQITFSLVIQDFSVAASPSILYIPKTFSDMTSITTTSQNGFSGQVSLTIAPSCVGVSTSSQTVTIAPGSPSTFSLTIFAQSCFGSYTVYITGHSGVVTHQILLTVQVTNFGLSSNPSSISIQAGTSSSVTITVTGLNGFSGNVILSAPSPHSGITLQLTPQSVSLSTTVTQSVSTLQIIVASNVPAASYTITVTGTDGTLSNSAAVSLTVTLPGTFTVSPSLPVTPSPINANSTGTSTITVAEQNGFSGTVTLSATSALGSGLSFSFNPTAVAIGPASPSATSTLTITATVAGTYTITVTGTNGTAGATSSSTFSVTVADFVISGGNVGPIGVGVSGTSTIAISAKDGFSSTITLAASTSAGLSASFTGPNTVTGSGSTSISVSAPTQGNYTLTVTASSGPTLHSISLIVRVGDFIIAPNTNSLNFNVGSPSQAFITLKSTNGLSGSISLTASDLPAEPTITWGFSPSTPTLPAGGQITSTLTITAASSTPYGNYTLTIIANSGSLTHTATITLTIGDFNVSPSPSFLTILKGSTDSSTITVTSLNGFSGVVALTDSFFGVGVSAIPNSVNVAPGAPGIFTLTISTQSASAGSTYPITVTGKVGSVSHSGIVNVQVVDFAISGNPSSVSIQAGGTGSTTILLTGSTGFSGSVTVSVGLTDPGITAQLNVGSVLLSTSSESGSAALMISVSSSVQPRTYYVTVTGTIQSLSHPTQVSVNVGQPASFNLQTSQGSLSIVKGSGGGATINVNSLNGFTGTVNLSVSSSASGLVLGLNPSSVSVPPNGSVPSTLSVSSTSSTQATTYTLTVTGTNGTNPCTSPSCTVKIQVTVQDFTISSSGKTTLTVLEGFSDTATITIGTLGGFTGTVTLSTLVSPTGPSASLSDYGPNVPPGGSATSTLSVGSGTASPGPYTVTVIGTFGSLSHNVSLTVNVVDFSITGSPLVFNIPVGTSQSSIMTLTSLGAFSGQVNLVPSSPLGLAVSCAPSGVGLLPGGQGFSTCKLTPSAVGSYQVSVVGTYGQLSHSVSISVTAGPPPDFGIAVSPASLTMANGVSNSTIVTLTSSDFAGTVNVAITASNPQAMMNPSQINITLSAGSSQQFTLTVSGPPTTFTVTIKGAAGSIQHSQTVSVSVFDFSVTGAVQLMLVQGAQASPEITITSIDGFGGPVSLSAFGPFNPFMSPPLVSVPAYSFTKSNLMLTPTSAGEYSVVVTATGSNGALVHSWTIQLHVTAYMVTATPSSIVIQAGSPGNARVNITSINGFSGTVYLTPSISPTGPSVGVNPTSAILTGTGSAFATLTITTTISTLPQVYSVTITANSGGLQESAQISVNVGSAPDFSITANPSSLIIAAGPLGDTSTITLSSLYSFSGTVTLTTNVPAGASAVFNPSSISLQNGGTAPSTLTISSSIPQSFNLQVVATSSTSNGILAHSVLISVRVWDFGITTSSRLITNVPVGVQRPLDLSLFSSNGFTGSVSIIATSTPAGLSISPSQQTVSLTPAGVGASLTISSSTPQTYAITVNATSGLLTHSFIVTVNVVDFRISSDQQSVTILERSTATVNITLTAVNGFTNTVTLGSSSSPPGPSTSVSPTSVSLTGGHATATLTISTQSFPAPGTYTVTVTGTSSPLAYPVQITVYVVTFSLSASASSSVLTAGSTLMTIINVTSQGNLPGVINLTPTIISGPSGGLTILSLTPNVVNPSQGNSVQSTLTLTSSLIGNYVVVVTGTSGSLSNSISIQVTVQDFGISSNLPTQSVPAGGTRQFTLTLTSQNGFVGWVNVTSATSPELSLSLSQSTVANCSSAACTFLASNGKVVLTLTVTTNSTTPPAIYSIVLTGMSTTVSHQATVTLTVTPPPSLEVPKQILTVDPGILLTFNVNASDTDNTLTIVYSPNPLPPGATFSLATRPGATTSVTGIFNWKPLASQGPSDYTITFTAQNKQGGYTISQVTIHVNGVSRSPGFLSSLGNYWYVVIATVGAVATVIGDRLLRQRKARLALAANKDS